MVFSEQMIKYTEDGYEKRRKYLTGVMPEIRQAIAGCSSDEALLLRFFYGTMPLSDAGEYPPSLFLSYIRHALFLRGHSAFCRELSEGDFLKYVLYYRVNSEKISDCRPLFYEQIKDRISGMSAEEAVLEINYWCAEHVAYHASDERTMAPLDIYKTGYGRCGEESAFLVSVLRSAGLAARQVYVPLWAHCDDNHAWAEVKTTDGWHYLGACEPEEVLDRGWFTAAASRAVIVHSRNFTDFASEEDGDILGWDGAVYYLNRTPFYADTVPLTIRVTDADGRPAAGVGIDLEIVNYAQYGNIARIHTGEDGSVSVRLGRGFVHAECMGAERWIKLPEDSEVTICLTEDKAGHDTEQADSRHMFNVISPAENVINFQVPDESQKENGRRKKEAVLLLKKQWDGRSDRLTDGEKWIQDRKAEAKAEILWECLTEKDRKDVTAEVLDDAMTDAGEDKAVLNPRVWHEQLRPYRKMFRVRFGDKRLAEFGADPEKAAGWVSDNISVCDGQEYTTIYGSAEGIMKLRSASEMGRMIFTAALLRAAGVQAEIDAAGGRLRYRAGSLWKEIEIDHATDTAGSRNIQESAFGTVTFITDDGLHYGVDWSVSVRRENGEYRTLAYDAAGMDPVNMPLQLHAGRYRVLTTNRNINGSQNVIDFRFTLKEGEQKEIHLERETGDILQMLLNSHPEDVALYSTDGSRTTLFKEIASERSAVVFLEPGNEPTEHVCNELIAAAGKVAAAGLKLLLVVPEARDMEQQLFRKLINAVPAAEIFMRPDPDETEQLARHFYIDPGKRPLLLLFDSTGTGRYGCSGYNVGSVELALKVNELVSRV